MIYLFATELEAQKFRKASPDATIVICGVGAAACAATTAEVICTMRQSGHEQMLILGGIAGSYNLSDVALCEVVEVIQEEIESLPEKFAEKYYTAPQTSLRAVTSNSVNNSREVVAQRAQIENMEGAAFAAICQRLNVNHLQIRAISNLVGDNFSNWALDDACTALCNALLNLKTTDRP